ncbi:hypothetical protein ACJJTC_008860 [Scirpophaga incertulas]
MLCMALVSTRCVDNVAAVGAACSCPRIPWEHKQYDPARDQLLIFKERTKVPIGIMTTSAGARIEHKDATVSLNRRLLFNEFFLDSLTHLVRERIPERVVNAKAAGAFGYFEVTHDITIS